MKLNHFVNSDNDEVWNVFIFSLYETFHFENEDFFSYLTDGHQRAAL